MLQISFGPISWLYCGEIFPLAVRGPAMAAADAAGCFSSLAVKMLLPELHRTIGEARVPAVQRYRTEPVLTSWGRRPEGLIF